MYGPFRRGTANLEEFDFSTSHHGLLLGFLLPRLGLRQDVPRRQEVVDVALHQLSPRFSVKAVTGCSVL